MVRQAPQDFHPPGYTPDPEELKTDRVEVPRTKFFCEEHKYLPGIYADTQLGCKVKYRKVGKGYRRRKLIRLGKESL